MSAFYHGSLAFVDSRGEKHLIPHADTIGETFAYISVEFSATSILHFVITKLFIPTINCHQPGRTCLKLMLPLVV